MIKVLEHGTTHRIGKCPECGCRFGYTKADVSEMPVSDISEMPVFAYLRCPECLAFEYEADFRDE